MTTQLGGLYTPSEWGDRFHRLTTDEALGAGAAGPGKSMVLLMEPVQQILIEHARCLRDPAAAGAKPGTWLWKLIEENPLDWGMSTGWALHLRRIGKSLLQTLSRAHKIFPQIDPAARWSGENHIWTFKSGFQYQFGHCKDADSWQGYMSQEYSMILWDELFEFDEEHYDQVCTRLRSSDPVLRHFLKIRAMSNPIMSPEDGVTLKDPFWVRRRFVDPCPEGNVVLRRKIPMPPGEPDEYKTIVYLPARLDDNPDKEYVRQYKRQLASAKPHIREALLYGNWYYVRGAYYEHSWDPRLVIIPPFNMPRHWKRFRSMDWGYKTNGTVLWWAMDDDENLVCDREYTFRLKHVDEVAEDIRHIERGMGLWSDSMGRSLITGPADTQLWEERGDITETKAEAFEARGIGWVKADKRSRKRNAELFAERLEDHQQGTVPPGICFFNVCKNCIQTIPTIPADKNDQECPADGGPDHWHDAVLYACAYASHGRQGIPSIQEIRNGRSDQNMRKRRVGRWGYGQRVC